MKRILGIIGLNDKILVPGVTEPGEVRTRKPVMAKCHDLGRRLAMQGGRQYGLLG